MLQICQQEMYLIVEKTLGKLSCIFSRKRYEKITDKSYVWSGFSKIGLQLVGQMDFVRIDTAIGKLVRDN